MGPFLEAQDENTVFGAKGQAAVDAKEGANKAEAPEDEDVESEDDEEEGDGGDKEGGGDGDDEGGEDEDDMELVGPGRPCFHVKRCRSTPLRA